MINNKLEVFPSSDVIEYCRKTVNDFFDIYLDFPIVYVSDTPGLLRHGLLPWAKSGIRKEIIFKTPGIMPDQIIHEMSHYALREVTKRRNLPIWFDEGLACYVSNMSFNADKSILKFAMQSRALPNVIDLKGLYGKLVWLSQMYIMGNTKLIYGQSYFMMDDLVSIYGKPRILHFLKLLNESEFEVSFYECFKITPQHFYNNFLEDLNKN